MVLKVTIMVMEMLIAIRDRMGIAMIITMKISIINTLSGILIITSIIITIFTVTVIPYHYKCNFSLLFPFYHVCLFLQDTVVSLVLLQEI